MPFATYPFVTSKNTRHTLFTITAFLFAASLSAFEPLPDRPIALTAQAGGREVTLRFQTDRRGRVTKLYAKGLYYNETTWGSARAARDGQGFYNQIPDSLTRGQCQTSGCQKHCVIHIDFSDEEVTTLAVFFAGTCDDRPLESGSLLEMHSDQGLLLFERLYKF